MTPLSQGQALVEPSDDELRSIWRKEGGRFHGPNVETGTMPESLLLPFLRALAASHAAPAADLRAADRLMDLVVKYGGKMFATGVDCRHSRVSQCDPELEAVRHAAAQLAAVAAPPKLPYDVKVGGATFRKGVDLDTFINAARRWHREAFPDGYLLTDEQKAANLARLQDGPRPISEFPDLQDAIREGLADGSIQVQGAAVAAPEARMTLTDEQILTCLNSLSPPSGRWKGPREHNIAFARAIEAALQHPAAPGSSMPSAAPLSEPCALDQGARPVRLTVDRINALARAVGISHWPMSMAPRVMDLIRAVECEHGITATEHWNG